MLLQYAFELRYATDLGVVLFGGEKNPKFADAVLSARI
jgi:hypothetical protein